MELLEFLKGIPVPIVCATIVLLLIITVIMTVQYLKDEGLDGIREEVYKLFLKAEHMYVSGAGKTKMKWVCQQARTLLPGWLSVFISEETLEKIIEKWFQGVKDLLDDGKVNGSGKAEE